MSQTWIPNTSGELDSDNTLSVSRGYINDAMDALRSSWSGSTAPSSPVVGQFFYDTDVNWLYVWTGATWRAVGDYDFIFGNLLIRSAGSSYPLSGDLYMGTHQIKGVTDPTLSTDAATKNYVDTYALLLTGGTMSGDIVCGANDITMDHNPTAATDLARKAYVDLFVPLAGGTMTGDLSFGSSYNVTNLDTPSAAGDATSKSYVDDYFDVDTGHDHDGVDSRLLPASSLNATAASDGAVPYVTSASASFVVPIVCDYNTNVTVPRSTTGYQDLAEVTFTLPSTSTNVCIQIIGYDTSWANTTARILNGADAVIKAEWTMTAGSYPLINSQSMAIQEWVFCPATTGSYTVTLQMHATQDSNFDVSELSLIAILC